MTKIASQKKSNKLKTIAMIVSIVLVIFAVIPVVTPIKTLRVGECPGPTIRLSVINDGWGQINQAEEFEKERVKNKEEFLKKHPGLAMGCSIGKTYKLYLL